MSIGVCSSQTRRSGVQLAPTGQCADWAGSGGLHRRLQNDQRWPTVLSCTVLCSHSRCPSSTKRLKEC